MLHTDFRRVARLISQLGAESRFVKASIPTKDWNWDKEVQSRILSMLQVISCEIANTHRKKGKPPVKPPDQFQPDYVKKAKLQYANNRKKVEVSEYEMAKIKDFWRRRNPEVKQL